MGANTEDPMFCTTLTNRVYVNPPRNQENRNQFAIAINKQVLEPQNSIASIFFFHRIEIYLKNAHRNRYNIGSQWALVIVRGNAVKENHSDISLMESKVASYEPNEPCTQTMQSNRCELHRGTYTFVAHSFRAEQKCRKPETHNLIKINLNGKQIYSLDEQVIN